MSASHPGRLGVLLRINSKNMSLLRELWAYMRARKKYWLIPIIVMLAVFGGLVILTKGSAVAPFIYTIF